MMKKHMIFLIAAALLDYFKIFQKSLCECLCRVNLAHKGIAKVYNDYFWHDCLNVKLKVRPEISVIGFFFKTSFSSK